LLVLTPRMCAFGERAATRFLMRSSFRGAPKGANPESNTEKIFA
jgi:hypothetical protein